MAQTAARRLAERPGGLDPGKVIVLRAQLVEHHIQDQVDWAEVAEAAEKIAAFCRRKQQRAWTRVQAWDQVHPDPSAA